MNLFVRELATKKQKNMMAPENDAGFGPITTVLPATRNSTRAPDGQSLAYSKALAGTGIYVSAIESVSLEGGRPTRILSSQQPDVLVERIDSWKRDMAIMRESGK